MLEKKLSGNRVGDAIIRSHIATNNVFENKSLENIVFTPHNWIARKRSDYIRNSKPSRSTNLGKIGFGLAYLTSGLLTYSTYVGSEVFGRVAESTVRVAGRLAKGILKIPYKLIDKKEKSGVKQVINSLERTDSESPVFEAEEGTELTKLEKGSNLFSRLYRQTKSKISQYFGAEGVEPYDKKRNARCRRQFGRDLGTLGLSAYIFLKGIGVIFGGSDPVVELDKPVVQEPLPPVTTKLQGEELFEAQVNREVERLGIKYDSSAIDYARQVIENGHKIKLHPEKNQKLKGEMLGKIKGSFPTIKVSTLFGFADDSTDLEHIAALYSAQQRVLDRVGTKYNTHLPMTFLVAALSAEGHSLNVDHSSYRSLHGFQNYGLDTFGSNFKHIVRRGFLDKEFKANFRLAYATNEKGQSVQTARFNDKEFAFEAFVAEMGSRQMLFYKHLEKYGIDSSQVTPEEVLFFTYAYYNGGPGSVKSVLRQGSIEKLHSYFANVHNGGAKGNSFGVLATHSWLDDSGHFNETPEGSYFWADKSAAQTVMNLFD